MLNRHFLRTCSILLFALLVHTHIAYSASTNTRYIRYQIQKSDTLYRVLSTVNLTPILGPGGYVEKTKALNPNLNFNDLNPGTWVQLPVVSLPSSDKYSVSNQQILSIGSKKPRPAKIRELQPYVTVPIAQEGQISANLSKLGLNKKAKDKVWLSNAYMVVPNIRYKVRKSDHLVSILKTIKLAPIYGDNGSLQWTIKQNPGLVDAEGNLVKPGEWITLPAFTLKNSEKYTVNERRELVFTEQQDDNAFSKFQSEQNNDPFADVLSRPFLMVHSYQDYEATLRKKGFSKQIGKSQWIENGFLSVPNIRYKIKKGDHLVSILKTTGLTPIYGPNGSLQWAIALNPGLVDEKGNLVKPGQWLRMPALSLRESTAYVVNENRELFFTGDTTPTRDKDRASREISQVESNLQQYENDGTDGFRRFDRPLYVIPLKGNPSLKAKLKGMALDEYTKKTLNNAAIIFPDPRELRQKPSAEGYVTKVITRNVYINDYKKDIKPEVSINLIGVSRSLSSKDNNNVNARLQSDPGYGIRFEGSYPVNPKFHLFAGGNIYYLNYSNRSENNVAQPENTLSDFEVGLMYPFSKALYGVIETGYIQNHVLVTQSNSSLLAAQSTNSFLGAHVRWEWIQNHHFDVGTQVGWRSLFAQSQSDYELGNGSNFQAKLYMKRKFESGQQLSLATQVDWVNLNPQNTNQEDVVIRANVGYAWLF